MSLARRGGPVIRNPIEIRLLVEPTRLRMAERAQLRVGMTATNRTQEAVDPQLYATRLLVGDEPAPAFDLAIGNGVMPAGWDLLAAGETTPVVRWPLGEALFPQPGEYRLVLRLEAAGGVAAESSATVVVTP